MKRCPNYGCGQSIERGQEQCIDCIDAVAAVSGPLLIGTELLWYVQFRRVGETEWRRWHNADVSESDARAMLAACLRYRKSDPEPLSFRLVRRTIRDEVVE